MSNLEATASFDRVRKVDEAVRTRGWNMTVARELADELGVDIRSVHRYWEKAKRWTRNTIKANDMESWRGQQVVALDQISREARAAGAYGDAVRALDLQAKIIGTIAPVKVDARLQVTAAYVPIYVDKATGESRRMTRAEIESELATRAPVGALPNVIEAASTVVMGDACGVAVPTVNGGSLTNDDDAP